MMTFHGARFGLATTLLVLGALGTAACSDTTGTGGGAGGSAPTGGAGAASTAGGGGSGGAGDGGGAVGGGGGSSTACATGPAIANNAACEACQNENCCTTAPACADNPECVAVQACVDAGTMTSSCYTDHPDGVWDYSGVATCRHNHCAAECGYDPPQCGEIIPTPESCTDEVQAMCCDVTAACGANDDCVAIIYQCIDKNGCADAACGNACLDAYPDGADAFVAMANCWNTVPCL